MHSHRLAFATNRALVLFFNRRDACIAGSLYPILFLHFDKSSDVSTCRDTVLKRPIMLLRSGGWFRVFLTFSGKQTVPDLLVLIRSATGFISRVFAISPRQKAAHPAASACARDFARTPSRRGTRAHGSTGLVSILRVRLRSWTNFLGSVSEVDWEFLKPPRHSKFWQWDWRENVCLSNPSKRHTNRYARKGPLFLF